MANYGEAAVVQMFIDKLPDIMHEAAKPMEQIDKITILNNGEGDGTSKVAKWVTDVTGNGFEALNAMTGLDIPTLISGFTKKTAAKGNDLTETDVTTLIQKGLDQIAADDEA